MKKKGLGRSLGDLGLSELLKKINTTVPITPAMPSEHRADQNLLVSSEANVLSESHTLQELPVAKITPGAYQPRKNFTAETIQELAQSIKSQGLIQPIIVRAIENNQYEIIAGERRWRAIQQLGWEKIPAIVREISNSAAMALGLIENIQREDLNPIEEAQALQRLINEFQLTHQQIAESIGKSRSAITNLLRLLTLSPKIKNWIEAGQIEMGHAKVLLALDPAKQEVIAQLVIDKKLTVRETEYQIKKLQTAAPNASVQKKDPALVNLQKSFSEKIGKPVSVRQFAAGHGQVVIFYKNTQELNELLEKLPKG